MCMWDQRAGGGLNVLHFCCGGVLLPPRDGVMHAWEIECVMRSAISVVMSSCLYAFL